MNKFICPNCGHGKFNCVGAIEASLMAYGDGDRLKYELKEWNVVIEATCYACMECDFIFEGYEDEFIKYLVAENSSVAKEN